ncbi:CLU domain [Trypanosoma melophagium]|uniref:CLU domain n=1 Tax=Trypanosoma melophagium TaxID=715481 RepID=UPI00351A0473|nr:CLU domain [Trypanosoma melophagium]
MPRLPPHQLPQPQQRPRQRQQHQQSQQQRASQVTVGGQRPSRTATNSTAATAATSSSRAAVAAVFWQLVGTSAPIYFGPLGDIVGEVPNGTVIRELHRCRDPFGSCWIASRASDGDVVWILLSTEQEDKEKSTETVWQRVYDERSLQNEATQSRNKEDEEVLHRALISATMNTKKLPSLDLVTRDILLLEEGWKDISAKTDTGRDWNAEYQELIDLLLFGVWEKSVDASAKLSAFMSEFTEACEDAALVVVADMVRPTSERLAKSVQEGVLGTFIYNNLLVKCVLNDGSGNYKSDAQAWRMASQYMRGQQLIAMEGPKRLLYTVPITLVTFTGFRFLVSAVPPIKANNLVYLPLQERSQGLHSSDTLKTQLIDLAQAIGLKPHKVKRITGDTMTVTLPVDMAIVAGQDKRLYIIGNSSLLPPIATMGGVMNGTNETGDLRFRAEFLLSWRKHLNSDAFVEDASEPEDNAEVMEATEYLRDKLIPTIAAMLGFHYPIDIPRQDVENCTLCSRTMENELRFVVCHNTEMCCRICSHCYTRRLSEMEGKDDVKKQYPNLHLFRDAVKCETSPRASKGLLLEPSLTSIFHANGLNMRFLPFVYYRIPQVSRPAIAHYCEIEMIARASLSLLREKLRRSAQTMDELRTICHDFLMGLLQSSGTVAERFWARELGPMMETLYGLREPFNTSEMDIELLYHRISQLSGIRLEEGSAASFYTEKPYLQLAAVEPIVKVVQPPYIADADSHAKTRSLFLRRLEHILLFWIGCSASEDDNAKHSPTQPFYMTERDSWS